MKRTTLGLSSILHTALHGSRASGGAGARGGAWPQTARSSESHPLPHGTLHFWVSIISLLTSARSETAARERQKRDSRACGAPATDLGAAELRAWRALSTLRTTDCERRAASGGQRDSTPSARYTAGAYSAAALTTQYPPSYCTLYTVLYTTVLREARQRRG